jgi:hypothetical protein
MKYGRIIRCIVALASLCLLFGVLFMAAPTHLVPVQAKGHRIISRAPRRPHCTPTPMVGPWYGGGPARINPLGTRIPSIGPGTPVPLWVQCLIMK